MPKTYVYKITRMDGKEYIGITVRLKVRFRNHELSERFEKGIKRFSILAVCDTYEEAGDLEEKYINQYDTFYGGLNESKDGKGNHLAPEFTTKGYKYSKKSRQKMRDSHWSKTGSYWPKTGKKHSGLQKKQWSKDRTGVYWGKNRKIPIEDWSMIYNSYVEDTIEFDKEFVASIVKKTQQNLVLSEDINISELKAKNGKPLTKMSLYAIWYGQFYDVAPAAIRKIIKNKGITAKDCK